MKEANLKKFKMFGGKVTILQLMVAIGIAALVATVVLTMVMR